jgi:8-oxo-dGTP diphosphatase
MKIPVGPYMERATLCFIVNSGRILLIKRKKGIGKGLLNGPGGRIEKGESPLDCVIRETIEETGITPIKPKEIGFVDFYLDNEMIHQTNVFRAEDFSGTLKETEEAMPKWFPLDKIPYQEMFAEDKQHWIPLVIERKAFKGKFYFDKNWTRLLKKEIIMV